MNTGKIWLKPILIQEIQLFIQFAYWHFIYNFTITTASFILRLWKNLVTKSSNNSNLTIVIKKNYIIWEGGNSKKIKKWAKFQKIKNLIKCKNLKNLATFNKIENFAEYKKLIKNSVKCKIFHKLNLLTFTSRLIFI